MKNKNKSVKRSAELNTHTHTHTQLLSTKGGYNVVSFLKGGVNL